MTQIKISLASKKTETEQNKNEKISFWFTSDLSIRLNNHKNPSTKIVLEKLSEKNFLELKVAYTLGIIDLDRPEIFKAA